MEGLHRVSVTLAAMSFAIFLIILLGSYRGHLITKTDSSNVSFQKVSRHGKVEKSLMKARAAIRKVPFNLNPNSSNGDIYRNAPVFYQSYAEMEKRFRIFVYKEGDAPLVQWGPCRNIYSTEGRFIHQLQLAESPFVTSEAETAHVFFLPFSVAMMVKFVYKRHTYEMPKVIRFVKDYIDVLANKYPYWNRSLGADHFMLSCHDWGPLTSMANPYLYNKSIRVLCNANSSEGFNPIKDVTLPEMNLLTDEYSIRTSHLFGGRPELQRSILAFFAGGNHGVIRPLLFKHWQGRDPQIQIHQDLSRDTAGRAIYLDYMKKSKYCLCPSGYEVASPRIVEAIYSECVPVVISEHYVLPFSDVLNWNAFSVTILPSHITKLKQILESIPMERYLKLKRRLKEVQKHFLINQPPKRYDMFNMVMHSVWLRRLNVVLKM